MEAPWQCNCPLSFSNLWWEFIPSIKQTLCREKFTSNQLSKDQSLSSLKVSRGPVVHIPIAKMPKSSDFMWIQPAFICAMIKRGKIHISIRNIRVSVLVQSKDDHPWKFMGEYGTRICVERTRINCNCSQITRDKWRVSKLALGSWSVTLRASLLAKRSIINSMSVMLNPTLYESPPPPVGISPSSVEQCLNRSDHCPFWEKPSGGTPKTQNAVCVRENPSCVCVGTSKSLSSSWLSSTTLPCTMA